MRTQVEVEQNQSNCSKVGYEKIGWYFRRGRVKKLVKWVCSYGTKVFFEQLDESQFRNSTVPLRITKWNILGVQQNCRLQKKRVNFWALHCAGKRLVSKFLAIPTTQFTWKLSYCETPHILNPTRHFHEYQLKC